MPKPKGPGQCWQRSEGRSGALVPGVWESKGTLGVPGWATTLAGAGYRWFVSGRSAEEAKVWETVEEAILGYLS